MKLISFHQTGPQLNRSWLLYSLGFMGLFLINAALASVIIYRYDPGPNTEQLPILVPTVVVGIAYCLGRIAGAILQPIAGYFSDHTEGRWGKRRPFLAASTLPLVMSFVLLFNPMVTATSGGNNVYLIGLLCLFYLASALYQIPFLAWLSELAPLPQQRVVLSSWLAIGSLVGAVFGAAATPWIIGRYGFETMTLVVATISLGTLLLPLLNDEQPAEIALQKRRLPLLRTLKMSWQNPTFRAYVLGISSAWVTMAILAACPTFFAIALLHRGVGFSALINALVFGGAACGMISVKPLVKRMGKKRALQISMLWSGGGLMLLAMASFWLGPSLLVWLLLLPLGSLGLGCFYILPNAMLPDVIDQDERLGKSAEAVYFGSRGLFAELSIGIGTLVVGLLLSLGKTAAEPWGVQLSLLVAGLFAMASAALLVAYPITK